jgi:hypothetical protein
VFASLSLYVFSENQELKKNVSILSDKDMKTTRCILDNVQMKRKKGI